MQALSCYGSLPIYLPDIVSLSPEIPQRLDKASGQ